MYKVIGIDISKAKFDAFISSEKLHGEYVNSLKGFKSFLKKCDRNTLVVMEASGYYHTSLAYFLHDNGIKVSVVNPLVIKRFSQMQLNRAKTDKKDAQTIARYAEINEPSLWVPESNQVTAMKQVFTGLELLDKQIRQTNGQLESLSVAAFKDSVVVKELRALVQTLIKKQEKLNLQLVKLARTHFESTYKNLQSIPGMGPKTAAMLIAITNNFTKFSHHKQLIAYVGFSPRIYQSGSSINGRGSICKMGKSQIRKLLYLCSWSAKKHNKKCVEMYSRLKEKGKPERVIKIAIANKLLKQAFAVAKSNQEYNENYQRNICF